MYTSRFGGSLILRGVELPKAEDEPALEMPTVNKPAQKELALE